MDSIKFLVLFAFVLIAVDGYRLYNDNAYRVYNDKAYGYQPNYEGSRFNHDQDAIEYEAKSDEERKNGKRAAAVAAIEALPELIEQVRKGNPIVEHFKNTFNTAMSLYGSLEGAKKVGQRHRSLELVIVNGIRKTLSYSGSYFDSGTFFEHPAKLDITPGGVSIILVANRQGSVLTGVTGGLDYEIVGDRNGNHLYIGFTNPHFGSYKTFVAIGKGKSAKWAYENSHNDSPKRKTEGGYRVTALIRKPKIAMKQFEYTIIDA